MKFTLLPIELMEEVVYYVDSSSDLLSLALVSRGLSSIVLPYHLPYRHIRCDIRRTYLWEHLAANPRRTRNVRFLGLTDERWTKPRLHPTLFKPMERYAPFDPSTISPLAKALSLMASLETFEWAIVGIQSSSDVNEISRSLLNSSSHSLRNLSLVMSLTFKMVNKDQLNSLAIWQLCSLTRVILGGFFESAREMLVQRCPNLEDLYLVLSRRALEDHSMLFEFGNWTKLRRLSLTGSLFMPATEEQKTIMSRFFQRHPTSECLLSDFGIPTHGLSESSLLVPRAVSWIPHVLNTSIPLTSFLFECGLSRIVHYHTHIRYISSTVTLQSLETLQIVTESFEPLPADLRSFMKNSAPNLHKLSFSGDSLAPMDIKRLIASLVPHSKVTHIHFSATFRLEEIEKLLRQFSSVKTLQYIVLPSHDKPNLCKKFIRNGSGKYLESRTVPASDFGELPSEWGNFFVRL